MASVWVDVGGAGFRWFPLRSSIFFPLVVELPCIDFSTALPDKPSLIKAKLAHFQVVTAGDHQHWLLIRVQLHLPRNPLAVEVREPPTFLRILVFEADTKAASQQAWLPLPAPQKDSSARRSSGRGATRLREEVEI